MRIALTCIYAYNKFFYKYTFVTVYTVLHVNFYMSLLYDLAPYICCIGGFSLVEVWMWLVMKKEEQMLKGVLDE